MKLRVVKMLLNNLILGCTETSDHSQFVFTSYHRVLTTKYCDVWSTWAVWHVKQSHCFVTSHAVTTSGCYGDIGDCSLITTLSWRPPPPLYFVIFTAVAVLVSLFLNSPLVSCGALTSHIITSVKYVPVHCHQSSRSEHRVTNRPVYHPLDTGHCMLNI